MIGRTPQDSRPTRFRQPKVGTWPPQWRQNIQPRVTQSREFLKRGKKKKDLLPFFFFFFHFVVAVKLLKRNKMKQPEKLEVSVWDALKKKKNGRDFSGVERRVEATYR